ncbi:hypothetical protein MVEN_01995900 [Mycena venus]|uniref:Uncharacterized protein n=1 Tax=Mycena venus TaxID=2733690 RepID=A0A8H6XEP0_9AGAR|nr:hypothetical protein MVEN_01995900 [Mycena venus]
MSDIKGGCSLSGTFFLSHLPTLSHRPMNCQFSFGPNRSYFCSAGSIYAWSAKSLPPALARLLEDSAHPQALDIPYDVAFPMEPGTYALCWKTKSGEDWYEDGFLGPSYVRLARFIKNVATKGAHTTHTVFGARASFFSMSPSGYCWQNLPPELEDDIHSCMKLRRPVNVALGVQGSYVVMYNDGTVTFDFRGQYPLVEKMIRNTQEAARRRGVMYIALNPFIAGEYYAVYGDGSASWNFPTAWSADVTAVSRQIKPIHIPAAPAPVVSPGGIPPKILPAVPVSPPPVPVSSGGTGPAPEQVPSPAPSAVSSVSLPSHMSMSVPAQVSSPVHIQMPPPAQAQTQTQTTPAPVTSTGGVSMSIPAQVSSPVHIQMPAPAQAQTQTQTISAPATSSGGVSMSIPAQVSSPVHIQMAPPAQAQTQTQTIPAPTTSSGGTVSSIASAGGVSMSIPAQVSSPVHIQMAPPAQAQTQTQSIPAPATSSGGTVSSIASAVGQALEFVTHEASPPPAYAPMAQPAHIPAAIAHPQPQAMQRPPGAAAPAQPAHKINWQEGGFARNQQQQGQQQQGQQQQGQQQQGDSSFDFSSLLQAANLGDQNQQQQGQQQQGDSSFDFSSLLQAANLDGFNEVIVQETINYDDGSGNTGTVVDTWQTTY